MNEGEKQEVAALFGYNSEPVWNFDELLKGCLESERCESCEARLALLPHAFLLCRSP